ncbi:MvaI/BcnI family restriction endonuclease [Lysinibacillus capsici]|uniref:MvaI/BcnI family restriction endonuclease n=1 Tax=Lysinibacillus capsici TaxID=2115968 RepID=UPI0028BDDB42|nr:MvaI/BcnI family restriction endonuclease [Lysinibacillus capsici]WNN76250.1 MvaI/BcnI family restriction endonuclease [Lysinibacillus capsici]
MEFIPNELELSLIQKITKVHSQEYALIRLTGTMLHKSIMDAGQPIRKVFKDGSDIDYATIDKGTANKQMREILLLQQEVATLNCSFYRPETKNGDPRFWIYGLKSYVQEDDLLYITTYNQQIVVIPLTGTAFNENVINSFFIAESNASKAELLELVAALNQQGPILSVSPEKSNAKDIGETLERALNILPNSSKAADFNGDIEIKAKRKGVKTSDTLFSMIPDWSASLISSSSAMIQNFGYQSSKYEGFIDLFVTVTNNPNNQGLYLKVDEEKNKLSQYYINPRGEHIETCIWHLDELEKRLMQKHPATLWVLAEQVSINGEFYYHYNEAMYTEKPLFASFLLLISKGYITYDWRGRVREDGSGYKDKGHCFRLKPKYRDILFANSEVITF